MNLFHKGRQCTLSWKFHLATVNVIVQEQIVSTGGGGGEREGGQQ